MNDATRPVVSACATIAGPDELTAAWVTAALCGAGRAFPPVAAVEVERIGEGVGILTRIYRLRLTYASPAPDAPASLIVKIAAEIPEVRALSGGYGFYEREVAFYRDVAAATPVRTPKCWAAAFDADSQMFVLLLEDVCDCVGGDQIAGLTPDQVRTAVAALADLHGAWWGHADLPAIQGVIPRFGDPPWDSIADRHAAAWPVMEPFLKTRLTPAMMDVGERLIGSLYQLVRQFTDGPRTLCHGDFRADNLMFGADGLLVLDWQIAFQAAGPYDIGYLMGASVTPQVRRDIETDLLRGYHARLQAAGVSDYSFDACFQDYRRALLIGFTYCVQGGAPSDLTNPRTAALFEAMALRAEAAVQDHGLTELLS